MTVMMFGMFMIGTVVGTIFGVTATCMMMVSDRDE